MRITRHIGSQIIDFILLERDASHRFQILAFAFASQKGNIWVFSLSNLGLIIKKGKIH